MDRLKEIGSRLKRLRQAAEITQEDLAERSNLTAGFISQIERGKTSISIDSLMMILDALNVHISDFFRPMREKIVYRAEDAIDMDRGDVTRYLALVPGAVNRTMEPVKVTLNRGEKTSLQPFSGEQFGYVLQGSILVDYGDQCSEIEQGQCFYAEALHEMTIKHSGRSTAEILWVTSPPFF